MEKIILFYKYIAIQYPKRVQKWQEKICTDFGLKGRVILAHEGINATLAGAVESIERYKALMRENELFADIDFKESAGGSDCFPRLQIKVKDEIVRFGVSADRLAGYETGVHLKPEVAHQLLAKAPKDLVIFDARNNYESTIGTFKNAVTPDIRYFRQLPEYIDQNLEQFADKEVLMFCTGGIRCEMATRYLKSKGVAKEVYQIEGGIHRYVEQYPAGFFEGKNYVFDGRLAMKVNDTVLSNCSVCAVPCDEYANCLLAACNKHYLCCSACLEKLKNTCSTECFIKVYHDNAPQRPPFVAAQVG